jgi:hypothetical protein
MVVYKAIYSSGLLSKLQTGKDLGAAIAHATVIAATAEGQLTRHNINARKESFPAHQPREY